jgi:hypothetical protein
MLWQMAKASHILGDREAHVKLSVLFVAPIARVLAKQHDRTSGPARSSTVLFVNRLYWPSTKVRAAPQCSSTAGGANRAGY